MRTRDAVWRTGERAALDAYRRRVYRVVARNWRSPLGELDLVVERDGVVVFCEVKTRSGVALGGGYEAVTAAKQRKVRALAESFLGSRRIPARRGYRFDVASVLVGPRGDADVHLFEDAF